MSLHATAVRKDSFHHALLPIPAAGHKNVVQILIVLYSQFIAVAVEIVQTVHGHTLQKTSFGAQGGEEKPSLP